jgi:NAD(P)-dependent dehydrogenase (short-subunit alcohol dehydrogenase family)
MGYFTDKVCVVTGGASGIGEAMVRELAKEGAQIVVADINELAAKRVAESLRAKGIDAVSKRVDVTQRTQVDSLIDEVVSQYGRIDVMVNNAGVVVVSEMEDTLDEDWDRLVDVNVKGVAYGLRAAFRQMKKQGFGQILNTASASGLGPTPLFTAYSATKHAVVGLSTASRIEGAGFGIKISALCPGVVNTPVIKTNVSRGLDRDRVEKGTPTMMTPEACAKAALKGLRKNRAIIPVGIDGYVPYLANRFIPGLYSAVLERSYGLLRKQVKKG